MKIPQFTKSHLKRLVKAGALGRNFIKQTWEQAQNDPLKDGDIIRIGKKTIFKVREEG